MNNIFSHNITLFDYQIKALEIVDEFLKKIFVNQKLNKQKAYDYFYYRDNSVSNLNLKDIKIYKDYFSELYLGQRLKSIPFSEISNRCGFWMATGSGKSLVMIKLIELLDKLMKKTIAKNNILILAPSDTILEQIRTHINLYNSYHTSKPIKLTSLKDFDGKITDNKNEIIVYYYRSNNIVDSESKDKQLNYEDFYNDGKWYLILDEAHKGESKNNLSKRKAIFTLLAKEGVIFNFSATFTDDIDKKTVIFDFKLDKFLQAGYGKKIMLLDNSVSVKNNNQLENIAKSLIFLAQMRKDYEEIKKCGEFYHSPLMITIANTVNTENADLKIFFEKLLQIAQGNFNFKKILQDLNSELKNKSYIFNLGILSKQINLTLDEFYKYVFNASASADIEYAYSKNKNELLFKLKNSNEYFMLLYIGDAKKWSEDILANYIPLKTIDENVFEELNERDEVSILLGSRMFIEGWDTNRVNIINYVELGKNDAEKLVLQSIGRGVRIEPVKNKRKRLNELDIEDKRKICCKEGSDYTYLQKYNELIESLFIFPSKKEYIESILNELKKVSDENKNCIKLKGVKKNPKVDECSSFLCIPELSRSKNFNNSPFYVDSNSKNELLNYVKNFDDATFILKHNITTRTLKSIKNQNFKKSKRNIEVKELIKILDKYWNKKIEEVVGFKILKDEIIHYQEICGYLSIQDIKDLENDIDWIYKNKKCPDDKKEKEKLENAKKVNEELGIDIAPIEEELNKLKTSKFFPELLECKVLMEHFYIPILYKENSNEFMYIIKNKSEIEFLKDLVDYVNKNNLNGIKWIFSRIDENVDNVKLPYFDTQKGEYRYFYPDFIFWIKKGEKRKVVFVDPKGSEHSTNSYDKAKGFEKINNLNCKNLAIELELYFYGEAKEEWSDEFSGYWIDKDKIDKIFQME